VALVRAKVALSSRRGSEATALLLTAAEGLRPFDPVLARDTYLGRVSEVAAGWCAILV
jgi:hypothetical protein